MSAAPQLAGEWVAKVILNDIRLSPKGAPTTVAAQTAEMLAGVHLAAAVHSNIATFSFPTPTVPTTRSPFPRLRRSRDPQAAAFRDSPIGINTTGRETWLNAAGNVIRLSRVRLDLLLRIHVTGTH